MDLLNGQVDAVVVDNPVEPQVPGPVSRHLEIVGGEPFTDEWYGIAVRSGGEDILAKINTGLAKVQSGTLISELEDRWLRGGTSCAKYFGARNHPLPSQCRTGQPQQRGGKMLKAESTYAEPKCRAEQGK
jgi:hypothetical protein